ncbi:cytochrome ubiquinol oxidase subunit I [Kineococcus gynurae]|uniref:Cytochrome ubiquinol oxidase subunit I n=1 Tax=Kineococcus gynurae TaxID=452979 RepID=A0ABV5LR52_9ACTN
MDVEALSRMQFAVTTIYHYFFVPLSISLALLTALLQTAHHRAHPRTGEERWGRLSLLTGKILMITFAVGVVTGLVQEFQFGLSWSAFARFYGDVFGPTLAVEGMLAFFLEATFLGLWWFGRDRLPARVHLATIWIVAVGTTISAFVILSANSFMQNPVAYTLDPETGRARLGSFADLLLNEVNLAAFPHTMSGALMAGGALVLAVGLHHLRRSPAGTDRDAFRSLARLGAWTTLVGGAGTAITGDVLGKVITAVQPMKMAAAEALYSTTGSAPFSLFAYAPPGQAKPTWAVEIPGLLSFLATGSFTAPVQGLADLQSSYEQRYGPGNYMPWVPVQFWTFRLMIGVGMLAAAIALVFLVVSYRRRWVPARVLAHPALSPVTERGRRILGRAAFLGVVLLPGLPLAANSLGWIFSENGRQPWLVFGLFRTAEGVSPGTTAGELVVSILGFTLLYGILAVVWLRLLTHLVRAGLPELPDPRRDDDAPGPGTGSSATPAPAAAVGPLSY